MRSSDGGKGDGQRPSSVDNQTFSNNWDAIFGKKKLVIGEPVEPMTQEKIDEFYKALEPYEE